MRYGSSARGAAVLALTVMVAAPLCADELPANRDATAQATGKNDEGNAPEDIRRWIAELSSDSFRVRSTAAERLLAAGHAASEPLGVAAGSFDPEVRAAARRLVVLIERAEFNDRLAAFAADSDGKQGVTLPGWENFRSLAGDDAAARNLFVEMQRQAGGLIEQVFATDPSADDDELEPLTEFDPLAQRFAPTVRPNWEETLLRRQAWQTIGANDQAASQLGSRVTVLFLASVPEGQISDGGVAQLVYMLQQPPLREAITSGPHHKAIRRLLTSWIFHCPNKSEEILKRRLDIASLHELSESLPLALAVSNGDPEYVTVQPVTKATAVLLVGQFGGPEHVSHLEPLLADDSLCSRVRFVPAGNRNGLAAAANANVELRDVALATMLHLTGQNPAEYGFTNAIRQPPGIYNLPSLYMESDEQRQAAAEKWRAWRGQESRVESGEPVAGSAKSSS